MFRFGILTVSTTCSQNPQCDVAGPTLERIILESFPNSKVTFKEIITDDKQKIVDVLKREADGHTCDVVFTVGGTGFAPSDVTPEATKDVIEKETPGLTHSILSRSLAVTSMAMLSRPICGIRKNTIIINFPGSTKAAVECFSFVKEALPHAIALINEDLRTVRTTHDKLQHPDNPQLKSKVKVVAGADRNRKSPYLMLEVEEARPIIAEMVSVSEEIEIIPIENALTRILAEDVKASKPIPSFPASVKDGYAVRAADGASKRLVRSVLAAGDQPQTKELRAGEIVRISTGAAVPAGADAVVQIEDTSLIETTEDGTDEKVVEILVAPKLGQDIRKVGSDVENGATVLEKYTRLSAATVGVLAMLGFSTVKVIKPPLVAVISTGNELCHPSQSLKPGQIYDSNKVTLLLLLKSYGYDATDGGIARDTPDNVKTTLEKAFEGNDVIISSGGVSMGEYDLLKQVLIEDFAATVHFGRVNMKPGKPTVFVTLDYKGRKKTIFALPGNPVSCCVTSLLFVIPALKRMEGDSLFTDWPRINVTLVDVIINNDIRPEYVRVMVRKGPYNQFYAKSTGNQISSRLNSMVNANALLLVPGKTVMDAGTCQLVLLFDELY